MRVLERNPLCLHLASKPRLCCLGRGAPHIWNNRWRAKFSLFWEFSTKIYFPFSRCCISGAADVLRSAAQALLSTIRLRLQALFNWVVMSCWGATPLVSLVTACIICSRRSLMGSHSRHPQPPPDVHWATGTVILPTLHQLILFLVTYNTVVVF